MIPLGMYDQFFHARNLINAGISEDEALTLMDLNPFVRGGYLAAMDLKYADRSQNIDLEKALNYARDGILSTKTLDRMPELVQWEDAAKDINTGSAKAFSFMFLSWRIEHYGHRKVTFDDIPDWAGVDARQKKLNMMINLYDGYQEFVEKLSDRVIDSVIYD